MKTKDDLHEWLDGVERAFSDPSAATGMAFFRYQAILAPTEDLTAGYQGQDLVLDVGEYQEIDGNSFEIPIAIDPAGFVMRGEELVTFGIEKVCDGVWALNPSLNMPDVLHVFVVIYDVPTPAPWEKSGIVITG